MAESPFEPDFMKRLDEYAAEKKLVRTGEDWRKFRDKWFDFERWPTLSPARRAAEEKRKRTHWNGWCYSFFIKDITPEARYEYFWAIWMIGFPLEAPHLAQLPKAARNGFCVECPFCEISSDPDRADGDACPRCGRALVLAYTESDDGPMDAV